MSSIFSVDEEGILDRTREIRKMVLENLVKDPKNLPTDAKTVEALSNLANGLDDTIYKKTKLTLDNDAAKSSEETQTLMLGLLTEFHRNRGKQLPIKDVSEVTLSDEVRYEFTPENLSRKPDNLTLDEFKART